VIIPYQELSPEAVRGIVEEVVTRDGTELSDAESMIAQVMSQLAQGTVVITYDMETKTCNIVSAELARGKEAAEG